MSTDTYKTLIKETKDYINEWKYVSWSQIRKGIMSVSPKVMFRFNPDLLKIPMEFYRN